MNACDQGYLLIYRLPFVLSFLFAIASVRKIGRSILDLKSKRGFTGLYQGHVTALLRIFPYSGSKFATYETVRDILIRTERDDVPSRRFISGAVAGMVSVVICYPLELVHVRMATSTTNHGPVRLAVTLSAIKGEVLDLYPSPRYGRAERAFAVLRNFYRGFLPTLCGSIPYNGVGFYTYNLLKGIGAKYFPPAPGDASGDSASKNFRSLLYGAVSGAVAQTSSYPIEVIRRTIQARTLDKSYVCGPSVRYMSEHSMFKTALSIYEKSGVRAFYSGLLLGYAKVIPSMSISFFFYEMGKCMFIM